MSQPSRLNVSSLIDLKAELCKKKEELAASMAAKQEKKKEAPVNGKGRIFKRARQAPPSAHQPAGTGPAFSGAYELEQLAKSAEALENKSRLYRGLERGRVDVTNLSSAQRENLLVDFGVKDIPAHDDFAFSSDVDSDSSAPSDSDSGSDGSDWIEFEDEFGRQRLVKRAEFEALQNERSHAHQLLDPDFQPCRYTEGYEIRNKGVAFYRFAADESERQTQQQQLRELRLKTEEGRLKALLVREERRLKLEQRLQRRRQRKTA